MLQSRADDKKTEGEKGWSILGYIKKFYGLAMMLGLMKMLLFPSPTESPLPEIKDPTNMKDLQKLNLTQDEMDLILTADTMESKKTEISKIVAAKNKEKALEQKRIK